MRILADSNLKLVTGESKEGWTGAAKISMYTYTEKASAFIIKTK